MKFKHKMLIPKLVTHVTSTMICAAAIYAGSLYAEATVYHHARSISFVSYNNHGGNLNVAGPTGSVSKSFSSSGTMSFDAVDSQGYPLPDGDYTYELELIPLDYQADLSALAQAEQSGDQAAYDALADRLQANHYNWQKQAGSFRIAGGLIKQPGDEGASDE